jgi:hypothetical protein
MIATVMDENDKKKNKNLMKKPTDDKMAFLLSIQDNSLRARWKQLYNLHTRTFWHKNIGTYTVWYQAGTETETRNTRPPVSNLIM